MVLQLDLPPPPRGLKGRATELSTLSKMIRATAPTRLALIADDRIADTARPVLIQLAQRWIRLASVVVGIGFVLYLLFVELIQLGNICLYCTGVHIATFLLFVLILFDSVFRQAPAYSAAPVSAKRTKG